MTPAKSLLSMEQRRARRAERRAKQRAANGGRAAKMHAARLEYARAEEDAQVSVAKPPIQPRPPKFNVGCSGWFYWGWKGRFYPSSMTTEHWFQHYAKHFDTVELNAPFYSWPTVAAVRSWLRPVHNRPFFYTVKVCELITHVKHFVGTSTLVKDFYFIDSLLKPHIGCFLFQLPPSLHYTAARLKRLVDQLDPQKRNVVEFRHASWWNKHTVSVFKKTNTIFCSCSAPRLPDELVQTDDEVYIRFHGTKRWYRHDYTVDELATWAKRIREQKPSRVWAYFNNDFDGHAIKNAQELMRQLKR
jgi:uncharacterized protein YecE (DUF72 family)